MGVGRGTSGHCSPSGQGQVGPVSPFAHSRFPTASWGLGRKPLCTYSPPPICAPPIATHAGCSLTCDCAPPPRLSSDVSRTQSYIHPITQSWTRSARPIAHSFAVSPTVTVPASWCSHAASHTSTLTQCHPHGLTRGPPPHRVAHWWHTRTHTHTHSHWFRNNIRHAISFA